MSWDEVGRGGTVRDEALMSRLREAWESADPVPVDLADRISFALALDDLEVELLTLQVELAQPVGARGEDTLQTVTFSGESLSVMVSLSSGAAGGARIDGWISDGGDLAVELRHNDGESRLSAGPDGRFAFDKVPHGLVQLVFLPTEAATLGLRRPVVTPAIRV